MKSFVGNFPGGLCQRCLKFDKVGDKVTDKVSDEGPEAGFEYALLRFIRVAGFQ